AIAITQDNFEEVVTRSTRPVIIDVYAPWCGPCQQMEPIFEELEKEFGHVYTFAKLNVDEARDIATHYGVSSIPTFILLKNNEVKSKLLGYKNKTVLKEKIQEAFAD